jgi:hypothetical protein
MAGETILYGAYGANRERGMVRAITGNSHLIGRAATFYDVELCVQNFDQIPDIVSPTAPIPKSPKELIRASWGDGSDFETYTAQYRAGSMIAGNIFRLTLQERALIANWELIEFGWYKRMNVTATLKDGTMVTVETEGLGDGQQIDRVVDGMNYPSYLNNPTRMFEIAARVREDFLALES